MHYHLIGIFPSDNAKTLLFNTYKRDKRDVKVTVSKNVTGALIFTRFRLLLPYLSAWLFPYVESLPL